MLPLSLFVLYFVHYFVHYLCTILCRCFHCDYSQLSVLLPAATCLLNTDSCCSNTCQLLCHYPLYISPPPSPPPLINLVSSWLTGRAGLLIRPVPSPDVNCATTSESISVLEKNILTRMLSHCSTIQLSVWEAARTSRHMIKKKKKVVT